MYSRRPRPPFSGRNPQPVRATRADRSRQLNYDPANVLSSAPPTVLRTEPTTCPRNPRGPFSPTELRPRECTLVGPAHRSQDGTHNLSAQPARTVLAN